jgi:hypothetical protein
MTRFKTGDHRALVMQAGLERIVAFKLFAQMRLAQATASADMGLAVAKMAIRDIRVTSLSFHNARLGADPMERAAIH